MDIRMNRRFKNSRDTEEPRTMLTSLKLAMTALAAATGGYALQSAIETKAPAPQPKAQTAVWTLASMQDTDQKLDRKVSGHIEGTVAEVAKWLTDQGVSFVIADEKVASRKIMVNLVDQPLKDAMEAIGDALGGRWEKNGGVYTFQSGSHFFPMEGGDVKVWNGKDLKDFKVEIPKIDGKAFTWTDDKGQSKTFTMPKIEIPKFDMKEFKFDAKDLKMSEAERKAFEKHMKDAGEAMKKALQNSKQWKIETKDLPDAKEWKSLDLKELKNLDELKELKELKKLDGKVFTFDHADIQKLIKSLTPAQKEKQKKQGYLTPADLTDAQRKMLGGMKDGSWSLTFVQDGQTLTIKSGK